LKREPRDVAISNYFIDYAAKFGGMGFAYDQSWIGEQLVDHQRLMNHWHQVLPEQILEVDYDLLVEDVESWAHRIIDYLQLPWEETVLSFQKLERAVKTASSWQVRQPIYTSSKAKWKRYAEFLSPLEAALAVVP
ncbi:sulfotransferase family protein, partial [Oceanospirillum linum]